MKHLVFMALSYTSADIWVRLLSPNEGKAVPTSQWLSSLVIVRSRPWCCSISASYRAFHWLTSSSVELNEPLRSWMRCWNSLLCPDCCKWLSVNLKAQKKSNVRNKPYQSEIWCIWRYTYLFYLFEVAYCCKSCLIELSELECGGWITNSMSISILLFLVEMNMLLNIILI